MKLDIIFHYEICEQTGEITYIGKDEITVDTAKKTTSTKSTKTKTNDNPDPIVTLDTNKLILTQGAVDLLQICEDCRVDIKYNKDGKPIIGTDKAFGTKGGNLLTQKLTVSYRGAANTKLATFGDVFRLEPTKDEGIFLLVGNKEPHATEVPEELVNIEDELDMSSLDDLSNNLDSKDLSDFDFTL